MPTTSNAAQRMWYFCTKFKIQLLKYLSKFFLSFEIDAIWMLSLKSHYIFFYSNISWEYFLLAEKLKKNHYFILTFLFQFQPQIGAMNSQWQLLWIRNGNIAEEIIESLWRSEKSSWCGWKAKACPFICGGGIPGNHET